MQDSNNPSPQNQGTDADSLLLVDDEAIFHRFFTADFDTFAVHSAYDSSGALKQLAAHPNFALAVVDLSFDGGYTFDGIDLIKNIHHKLPNLPIIAISKHQSMTAQTQTFNLSDLAIQAGAKSFKSKADYSISGWQQLFRTLITNQDLDSATKTA